MAMAAARARASSLFAMLLVSLEGKDGRRASRFGRNVHRPCGGTGRYDGFGSSLPAAPGGRRAGSPSKLAGPAAGVIPTGSRSFDGRVTGADTPPAPAPPARPEED